MIDWTDSIAAFVGALFGARLAWKAAMHGRRRHKHVWEVVEKNEQPAPWELIGKAKLTSYVLNESSFYQRPVIVTYRCACTEERVERV